jgi:hypothetical protein
MRRQPLQAREGAHPDVAFPIFEERLHGVAGDSIVDRERLDARVSGSRAATDPPQSLILCADPEISTAVVKQIDTPASAWRSPRMTGGDPGSEPILSATAESSQTIRQGGVDGLAIIVQSDRVPTTSIELVPRGMAPRPDVSFLDALRTRGGCQNGHWRALTLTGPHGKIVWLLLCS